MRSKFRGKDKVVKTLNLSSLDGVYNVSLSKNGKAAPENYAKAEHTQRHEDKGSYDDVKAQLAKAGL